MAFEYKPFINPYIGSISELMGKGDEAKAAALIRIGEIQARAAEQQGQAWGNAIQGLGNIASKTITDYNSPEARRQREVDKGNAILKARALEQQQYEAQRVARGNLVPGRDELQFIPATTGSNPFDAPFKNVNFGGGSRPSVTANETIENALPNEGLRNALSRGNVLGPTEGVLGAPPQVAQPDALSRGMQGALGTTEMRRTLPTGRPDRIETYKQEAVGRYVTAEGLYDVKTAYRDLVKAGISNEVATHLAKQGLEANTIFSMADDLAEKSRKSQVAVAGSIANLALQAHAANPTVSLEDTVKSLQGPSGNRIPQDQLDKFEVAFFGKSSQEQESILRSMVQQWDAQGKGQAFAPGSIVRGEFSGNQEQVGTAPVAEPSAASQTLAIARADFAKGIKNGSIPSGTNFTDWFKKTPQNLTNADEALDAYAKSLGYTGDNPRLQLTRAQRMAYDKQNAINTHIESPSTPQLVVGGDGNMYSVNKRTNTVEPVLSPDGTPMGAPLSTSTRTMSEGAKAILPHVADLRADADKLDALGLFGPLQSRIRAALAKMGTLDLSDSPEAASQTQAKLAQFGSDLNKEINADSRLNNKEVDRLVGRFASNLKLMASGVGRVHGGARGGGSIQMINYMTDLLSDSSTIGMFQGRLDGVESYMKTYANPGGNSVNSPMKNDSVPDLTGLKAGQGRTLKDGPFKGQTWAINASGQPYKVED